MAEARAGRYLVTAGWDHAPHLSEAAKARMAKSFPPHELEARRNGTPALGSGAVYPVHLDAVTVAPFEIPVYWPRAYALDVGWQKTAALWGAWNPADGCLTIYSEYYQGQREPVVHAEAIKTRGAWIKGVIDPAARGRSQADGTQLIQRYRDLGLIISPADNSVEAGLFACHDDLTIGRIKVFSTLENFKSEYRVYQRDQNGRIVKKRDHLMDCMRYLRMSGRAVATTRPAAQPGRAQGLPVHDRTAGY